VVLGNKDSDARFEDSLKLLQFGLGQYRPVQIIDKGYVLAEASVPFQGDGKVQLVTDGSLETQMAADEVITTEVIVDKTLTLPIKAGEVYGHVVVKVGSREVGRVNLVTTKSFRTVTLGSKLAYYWHRLVD
jgi:serine-type D-Ala-D-Ala carboxypeptidase (penicillin-binding protein 5/6)